MRTIRHLCASTFLILVFALSASGGEMQTPGITSTPLPRNIAGEIQLSDASVANDVQAPGAENIDPLMEIALALAFNVMSVF